MRNNKGGIIIAHGNPPHLHECLQSIEWCDEIVVINIGLEPQILQSLKDKKINVIHLPEKVRYVEQIRQRILDQVMYEYILFVDPDEIIPPQLASLLVALEPKYSAVSIPRKNIIFNKWIAHSRWWPDRQIRYFRKNAVKWPTTVHSPPQVSGEIKELPAEEHNAILHYNYHSVTEFFEKMQRYAFAEAEIYIKMQKPYSLAQAMKEGTQEFVSRFFAGEGYKDGVHGFVLAMLQMIYKLYVYLYVWEANGFKEESLPVESTTDSFVNHLYGEVSHWLIVKKLLTPFPSFKRRVRNKLFF